MNDIRRLTILHSNDPHGAFDGREKDGKMIGGIACLANCLEKIRKEERNTLYAIAGDLFRGSLIDSEFKGISTIEMINLLRPDAVTVGNHEVDYGLAHLLFLEKCARFPIVNANMYVTGSHKRLFEPYHIIGIDGMKVMFIGIVTDGILTGTKSEELIADYLGVDDANRQIKTIIDSYKTVDVDVTVLLSHIGYDEDKRLAERLGKDSGIDIIIGAHSHTLLKKPKYVNGIPIVQAGSGFEHLGRFDLEVDLKEHRIREMKWSIIDIDSDHYDEDELLSSALKAYRREVDSKSRRVLTTLSRCLCHPSRHEESEVANLFADLMKEDSSFDIMMLGCGSFRGKSLGPVVDYQTFREIYPFDNAIYMLKIKGKQFRKMCHHFLKNAVLSKGSAEFFAFSKGVRAVYDSRNDTLEECSYEGRKIEDDDSLKIALQEFHLNNAEEFLGIPYEELCKEKPVQVVKSDASTYEELLSESFGRDGRIEGRTKIL